MQEDSKKGSNRYLYLIKNIGFLTIGNFSTKLLSFFLVPLYTSILTTADYGSYDLVSTTISLLIPILTLNIADGTLRYSIDRNTSKKDVFTISAWHYVIGLAIAAVLAFLNYWLGFFPSIQSYSLFFILQFALTALNNILSSFARGLDKVKQVSIAGVLGSFTCIVLNIVFLAWCGFGLSGYFWANILGVSVQVLFLAISTKCWKYISFKKSDTFDETQKKMHTYSFPLIANNLAWWVNNASDRYMVTWIRSVAENGIYSVAYKIPSILSILQTIFQQAWTLSAVKDYDSQDRDAYFTKVYNMLNFILVMGCSVLIMFDKILARFLYANDFYTAWEYVPVLLMAMIFSGMANYIGGIFQAANDTKIIMTSTLVAAGTNIVLNLILIYQIGAMGAAIATLISNATNWAVRLRRSRKYAKLGVNLKRDIPVYLLLLAQSVALFLNIQVFIVVIIEVVAFIVIVLLYFKEIKSILEMVKTKVLHK
ncbi:MAG: flippase [Prevotellaceae bacterium]|nr:flippase [Prevotellaceae bacterium]